MNGVRFEKITRLKDVDFNLPMRKTAKSAGYDMEVAEDIIIPPYNKQMASLDYAIFGDALENGDREYYTLNEIAAFTKKTKAKPTLVSTGVKCYLPEGYYLKLAIRSSCPLKYWLIIANGEGIIDADYADNPDNEGEIFFQIINLSTVPIKLQKGDIIGQGIILPFETTENDIATGIRQGGLGSTSSSHSIG